MSAICSGQCLIKAHADCPETITVGLADGITVACECDCHTVFHQLEMEAV